MTCSALRSELSVTAYLLVTRRLVIRVASDALIGCVTWTVTLGVAGCTRDALVTAHERKPVLRMAVVRRLPTQNRMTRLASRGKRIVVLD